MSKNIYLKRRESLSISIKLVVLVTSVIVFNINGMKRKSPEGNIFHSEFEASKKPRFFPNFNHALILAAKTGNLGLINKTLFNGKILNKKLNEDVESDNLKRADLRFDINFKDYKGGTALHYAVQNGKIDIIYSLLFNGVDTNIQDNNKWTALHKAVLSGDKNIVKLLLLSGADIDARNNIYETPLFIAAKNGNRQIVEMLLNFGADIYKSDNNLETPYEVTLKPEIKAMIHSEEVKRVKNLIQIGAPDTRDSDAEWTPLYRAVGKGDKELAELLLKAGADVNARNTEIGETPLHLALEKHDKDMVKLLLDHGADTSIRDNGGLISITPEEKANEISGPEIRDLINYYSRVIKR